MGHFDACLIDAYDTAIVYEFAGHGNPLADLSGVAADLWADARDRVGPAITVGQISIAEGYELMLRACGVMPEPDLIAKLTDLDRELLHASAKLYDDAIPLFTSLRKQGIKTAIVSNCGDTTRGALVSLGLAEVTDELVLSCEVGYAKPASQIYQTALDLLGVTADRALFVDDQPVFCAAAGRLGITAVRILRNDEPEQDWATVNIRSLLDINAML